MIMHYLFKAIDWLNPLVNIVGLLVSIWAFQKCRKNGYLVVAIYFVLAMFALFAMPIINRRIAANRAPKISEETQERLFQEVDEVYRRIYEEEGITPMTSMAATRRVNFPLGPIILVAGLWLVAKNEKRAEPSARGDGIPPPQP